MEYGIIAAIVGVMASVELGKFLPFSDHLETRHERRTRRIYLSVACIASTTAATILHTLCSASYSFSILITAFIFYAIYLLAKVL